MLDSLSITAKVSLDSLRSLSTKSWVTDGLDREEAAFVIAISRVPIDSPTLYQRLIDSHYTKPLRSPTLAGDVKVWVFSDRPFKRGEDYAIPITDTARIMEDFLKVPFPTTDIILILQESCGAHFGSHMCLARVGSVPHETAHYYFRRGPKWMDEGGAEFMADLVADRLGARDFAKSRTEAAGSARQCTESAGFENIRHITYVYDNASWHIPTYATASTQWGEVFC